MIIYCSHPKVYTEVGIERLSFQQSSFRHCFETWKNQERKYHGRSYAFNVVLHTVFTWTGQVLYVCTYILYVNISVEYTKHQEAQDLRLLRLPNGQLGSTLLTKLWIHDIKELVVHKYVNIDILERLRIQQLINGQPNYRQYLREYVYQITGQFPSSSSA